MDYMEFIRDGSVILIPTLYVLGMIIKGVSEDIIKDKYIPLILLTVGVILSILKQGAGVEAVIQGVLVTGVAVYTNQLFKQITK